MSSSYLSFPTSTPPPLVCLLKSIDDFRLCYPSHCHRPYIPIAVQLPQLHHTLCERGHCRVAWSCLSLTAQTHSYITPLPCLLLSLPVAQSKCAKLQPVISPSVCSRFVSVSGQTFITSSTYSYLAVYPTITHPYHQSHPLLPKHTPYTATAVQA